VHATLADPVDCVFFASQRADDRYYESSVDAEPRSSRRPDVDRSVYVDMNAAMVKAYLHAGEMLADRSLTEFGVDALDRLLAVAYLPGAGVAHGIGDHAADVRGLLGDQVRASAALVDAYAASDRLPYLMLAEELMRYAVRTMWDDQAGGFRDRTPRAGQEIGLLREPHRPLALNCEAARVLHRLGVLTDQDELRALALATLGAMTSTYRSYGLWGAEYGLAAIELLSTPDPPKPQSLA
jgi:uncharacterized protein YyaL (SSP411 family)